MGLNMSVCRFPGKTHSFESRPFQRQRYCQRKGQRLRQRYGWHYRQRYCQRKKPQDAPGRAQIFAPGENAVGQEMPHKSRFWGFCKSGLSGLKLLNDVPATGLCSLRPAPFAKWQMVQDLCPMKAMIRRCLHEGLSSEDVNSMGFAPDEAHIPEGSRAKLFGLGIPNYLWWLGTFAESRKYWFMGARQRLSFSLVPIGPFSSAYLAYHHSANVPFVLQGVKKCSC